MKRTASASSTANIRYGGADYTVDLFECDFFGSFNLDQDWRTMDYAQGDSSLALSVRGVIALPPKLAIPLANLVSDSSLDDDAEKQIVLDIGITHTDMNAPDSFVSYPLDSLPLFPTLRDLQDFTANMAVCDKSGFYFGDVSELATVTRIQIFGEGIKRSVLISGFATDALGKVEFSLSFVDLPFAIVVQIAGYANEFVGATVAQRQTEILDCFASVYDASDFDAVQEYAAEQDAGMRYRFFAKS